jgi:hypothetical protein
MKLYLILLVLEFGTIKAEAEEGNCVGTRHTVMPYTLLALVQIVL